MVAADYTTSRTNTMLSETGKEACEEFVKTAFAKDVNGHEESSIFADEDTTSSSSECHVTCSDLVASSSEKVIARNCRRMVRFLGARDVLALGDDFVEEGLQVRLMKSIQRVKSDLSNYEDDFLERSSVHVEKATARLEVGNERGAILSMRKIHKMRVQQITARAALKQLHALEQEVEAQIWSNWTVARKSYLKFGRRLSIGKELPSLDMYKEKLNDILITFDLSASVSYPDDKTMIDEFHQQRPGIGWVLKNKFNNER